MKQNVMTYTFHHDDGHGWLEVPYKDMLEVGLRLDDISRYSYAVSLPKGNTMFLEEDIDLAVFMLAAHRAGKVIKFRHIHEDGGSEIRTYPTNSGGRDFDIADIRAVHQACEIEGVFA